MGSAVVENTVCLLSNLSLQQPDLLEIKNCNSGKYQREKSVQSNCTGCPQRSAVMDQLCLLQSSLGWPARREYAHWCPSNTGIFSYGFPSPDNSAMRAPSTSSIQGLLDRRCITAFSIQMLHRFPEDHHSFVRFLASFSTLCGYPPTFDV